MSGLGVFGIVIVSGVCILIAFLLVALIAFIILNRSES